MNRAIAAVLLSSMSVTCSLSNAYLANKEWVKCHTRLRGEGHAELIGKITADVCTVKGGCLSCVIAPDCEFSVSVVIPVAPTVEAGEGYGVMELPEVSKAAVAVHRGSLKTCGRTWNALAKWLKAQGKIATGQYREVYILGGHNPEPLWITELQLPLA